MRVRSKGWSEWEFINEEKTRVSSLAHDVFFIFFSRPLLAKKKTCFLSLFFVSLGQRACLSRRCLLVVENVCRFRMVIKPRPGRATRGWNFTLRSIRPWRGEEKGARGVLVAFWEWGRTSFFSFLFFTFFFIISLWLTCALHPLFLRCKYTCTQILVCV